jgi:mannose/cellobiose epimerase-like protein (N-acyl-D-glucosamine 2-epimerase family)
MVVSDDQSDDGAIAPSHQRGSECLRAALMMWETEGETEFLGHAAQAASAVWPYLRTPTPGLWRDVRRSDGGDDEGPSPDSSLYHLRVVLGAARPE